MSWEARDRCHTSKNVHVNSLKYAEKLSAEIVLLTTRSPRNATPRLRPERHMYHASYQTGHMKHGHTFLKSL
jgi:hypothetical protein